MDQAYALALPTYAATAFYHHKLASQPAALEPFLAEVEKYALGDYMNALLQGSELPETQKQAVAAKLHDYTGLPVAYLLKANLRVSGGAYSKNLRDREGSPLAGLTRGTKVRIWIRSAKKRSMTRRVLLSHRLT